MKFAVELQQFLKLPSHMDGPQHSGGIFLKFFIFCSTPFHKLT